MKKFIAAIALVMAMVFGGALAAAPAQAANYWDCDTTGTTQCAGYFGGIGDAWETFDTYDIDYGSATEPRHLRYYKTYEGVYPMYPAGSAVVLKSPNRSNPSVWHVFVYFTP